ncbi:hypothetical protein NK6_8532 [Bradyrhizobium diazoefficiens]|uniref:Uncharacterized protein n=1 Tax=Bradyrhizobium diazoefficiens TaxID=1355477 RepID=A0A0E4G0Y1_9BRAD|nr:hypothetical protein NK6_8532 [Bradyrhizobium diazoefficiens]
MPGLNLHDRANTIPTDFFGHVAAGVGIPPAYACPWLRKLRRV